MPQHAYTKIIWVTNKNSLIVCNRRAAQTNFGFIYSEGSGHRRGVLGGLGLGRHLSLEYKLNFFYFRLKSISGCTPECVSSRFVLFCAVGEECGSWGRGTAGYRGMAASFNGRRIRSCPTWLPGAKETDAPCAQNLVRGKEWASDPSIVVDFFRFGCYVSFDFRMAYVCGCHKP